MNTDNFNQEINLFKIIFDFLKTSFLYLKNNLLIIILLIISGASLGYVLTPVLKKYESKIIIIPNFQSTDYLYNDIELLNSRIKEGNLKFLEENKINNSIIKIDLEPIVNIYQFIEKNDDKTFNLLKLFAEDGDINKVSVDEKTSKNYKTHELKLITKDKTLTDNDINNVMNFLNKNKHYTEIHIKNLDKIRSRIKYNNEIIDQIDQILLKQKTTTNIPSSLNLNIDSQLNNLISTKRELIEENEELYIKQVESTKIIKDVAQTLNSKNKESINYFIVIIPIIFLIIFFIIQFSYNNKKKQNNNVY